MRIESNRKVHRTNRLSLGVLDMYEQSITTRRVEETGDGDQGK